jgi:hypothetical protein
MRLEDIQKKIELRLPSAKMLVLTNIVTIMVAIVLQMDPSSVVWAYWLESVVIGLFTAMTLVLMSGRSLLKKDLRNSFAALGTAAFFCFHYGFFHAVYSIFLYVLPWFTPDISNLPDVGIIVGILLISHGFSFVKNMLQEPGRLANNAKNRKEIMGAPYSRIIPMHIAIIASGFILMPMLPFIALAGAVDGTGPSLAVQIIKMAGLVVFMAIKTLADLVGHVFRYKK